MEYRKNSTIKGCEERLELLEKEGFISKNQKERLKKRLSTISQDKIELFTSAIMSIEDKSILDEHIEFFDPYNFQCIEGSMKIISFNNSVDCLIPIFITAEP
jgi:hypothetical protein